MEKADARTGEVHPDRADTESSRERDGTTAVTALAADAPEREMTAAEGTDAGHSMRTVRRDRLRTAQKKRISSATMRAAAK